jgi:hypothetical protein
MMRIFGDSGAWSIHQSGKQLTIDDYCTWITKHKDELTCYANLDVINDGQASYDNWVELRKRGFTPLPVYHASTSPNFLEKYLAAGAEYICLGAIARMNTHYRVSNLDLIWANHLLDKHGMPKVKVHGFGLTSLRIMLRYPWYSVDSTSWAFAARNGLLFIPPFRNGKYQYTHQWYKRFVSTRSPRSKGSGGEHHIDAMGTHEKKLLKGYLDSIGIPYGESRMRPYKEGEVLQENDRLWNKRVHTHGQKAMVETIVELGVINDQRIRNQANILFFLYLSKEIPKWPWAFHAHRTHRKLYV